MVDIRIMAHPKRMENVLKMLESLNLPDDIVVWDDREVGGDAMYTARKAWQLPIPEGCTHRLVLQDDGELCEHFIEIAEKVAEKHPKQVVTFFHAQELQQDVRYLPFVFTVGVALMIPVCLLDDLWWFVDNEIATLPDELSRKLLPHDTSCIRHWMRMRNIDGVTTVPTLVQHIGDESIVGINRKRIAPDFCKHPPIDDW